MAQHTCPAITGIGPGRAPSAIRARFCSSNPVVRAWPGMMILTATLSWRTSSARNGCGLKTGTKSTSEPGQIEMDTSRSDLEIAEDDSIPPSNGRAQIEPLENSRFMSASLIGHSSQTPLVSIFGRFRFVVAWVTLLYAVGLHLGRRCKHWSEWLESRAYGRAFKGAQKTFSASSRPSSTQGRWSGSRRLR